MKRVLLVALLVGAVSAVAFSVRQDPSEVPTTTEVFKRVMSPFCPGVTLYECTSSQAAELRASIANRVERGATNAEIDRWLTDNYGEAALARPKSPWVWAPPAAGILLAMFALTRRLTGNPTSNQDEETSGRTQAEDELEREIAAARERLRADD